MTSADEIFCLIATGEAPDGAECLGYLPKRPAIADMDPNAPMRLAEAAAVYGFPVAALRTEVRKGPSHA